MPTAPIAFVFVAGPETVRAKLTEAYNLASELTDDAARWPAVFRECAQAFMLGVTVPTDPGLSPDAVARILHDAKMPPADAHLGRPR